MAFKKTHCHLVNEDKLQLVQTIVDKINDKN